LDIPWKEKYLKWGENMKIKINTFCLLLFFGAMFFQAQPSLSVTSNNIAIAAVRDNVNSEISMIAGKALYYLIFDENGVLLKPIKNPGQNSSRNSSSIVVDLLLKESCKTVIAGKFGEKLKHQLKANNIEYYEREGIVKTVIQTLELAN
jgi:predicted Fe-Mo cluster-binding NifX family protein